MTPAEVRARLVAAVHLDLVGPAHDDGARATEILGTPPSRWYLCGFLVPYAAQVAERGDDGGDEQIEDASGRGRGDDEPVPDTAAARKDLFPSSMGLSVIVPPGLAAVRAYVSWGDYAPREPEPDDVIAGDVDRAAARGAWHRTRKSAIIDVPTRERFWEREVDGHAGVWVVATSRPVRDVEEVTDGARALAVFVVNRREPLGDVVKDKAWMFQVRLHVVAEKAFEPRPDVRDRESDDYDEAVADLQYRQAFEYVVGHNVSAHAIAADEACREVETTWIPHAHVEKVIPRELPSVELSMERLAELAGAEAIHAAMDPLADEYAAWIAVEQTTLLSDPRHAELVAHLTHRAAVACQRIRDGIQCLVDDESALEAFRIANRTIAVAVRQRDGHGGVENRRYIGDKVPKWYPFQLAFLLMNIRGIANPNDLSRDCVDLLFFPTGGGKTEAYLGLAAFAMALRRLRNPGKSGGGVSVLMRYTLRLLTLDQLGRAATLVCALEQVRQEDTSKLGSWPFEIGLWVGQAATPNRMGHKGDNDDYSARARTLAHERDDRRHPPPIPLENCPWCGSKFTKKSFKLLPSTDYPKQLRVRCADPSCRYKHDDLPILSVDENVYRRLPAFLIATVDKFAGLPWVGESGALFGRVERADDDGFYGAVHPGTGSPLPARLPPPDLIIQDELHLISGPLGTIAGLYETAIDKLCEIEVNGKTVRPKIVASTATVRRASSQIRALFGRTDVDVFPPPGQNRKDSFFALTVAATERAPRDYIGVAAQGRSLKVVLLRATLALMGAAQKAWIEEGGAKAAKNAADPYMTLLGYFNSLRELGGSRRIIEDEVENRLRGIASSRRRVSETTSAFANRDNGEPIELTSRVSTSEVAEAKHRLSLRFNEKGHVDVALATNMISVGLDITRLGLMVVLGQPKMTAEYIQATSRVGRDDARPGLVVTLLNLHRPRDRSHYERFEAWHECFYRQVEATSVTPFSPRALDRALAAVTVALARHGTDSLTAAARAGDVARRRDSAEWTAEVLSRRAERVDATLDPAEQEAVRQNVKKRVLDLLDAWEQIAISANGGLQYGTEIGQLEPLLRQPLDPELAVRPIVHRKFRAPRSLRDVEPAVDIWVVRPDGGDADVEQV